MRDMLEHSCRITTPTLLGFGKSSALPKEFSLEEYGSVLAAWLARDATKPVTLVGHSFGGAIALIVASRVPKLVRRLVLVDSIGFPFERNAKAWARAWAKQRDYNVSLSFRRTLGVLARPFTENVLHRSTDVYRIARLCMVLDVRPFLPGVRCPVDIVWGDQDDFIPRSVGERLHALIPQSTFHTVPGSHDWPLLEPEKLLPFIE
jgi:pimeloyl-ACP methyl ester carboxylesterase